MIFIDMPAASWYTYGQEGEDGKKAVGVVWVHIMNDYGHIDNDKPSFAISLYKDYRGTGMYMETEFNGRWAEYGALCMVFVQ